jgi:outer membrane lipoprotein LolB
MRRARLALLLTAAALIAGCAARPPQPGDAVALSTQEARESTLRAQSDWALQGRLAVSNGKDGGNGQLSWQQQGEQIAFEMRAPVSRQTWRLSAAPGEALLEGLDGGPRRGTDAEALLRSELGWTLPLADLASWVRGLRGEGRARIEFDPDGLPRLIEQRGWLIEYRGWDRSVQPPLPSRVFARRDTQRVRLAIERWDNGR